MRDWRKKINEPLNLCFIKLLKILPLRILLSWVRIKIQGGCNSAVECLLPKQDVVGSNPITRSIRREGGSCYPPESLAAQLERYQFYSDAQGYSPATVGHVSRCLAYFSDFIGGIEDVGAVSGDSLRKFIVYLRTRKVWQGQGRQCAREVRPATINTYARAIKSFWGWLEREGTISSNPLAGVPAPRFPKKLPRIYSEQEINKILNHVLKHPRERVIFEILLDSGIRLSELTGLNIADVELGSGRIRVFGKGSRERNAYISSSTAHCVRDYIRNYRPEPVAEDRLLLRVDGFPLCAGRIQHILQVLGRKAGIGKRLSPHNLRHTYATMCLKNGNNLEYLRIALGHTDIKTTSDAYLAASDADVADACRRYSPMANLGKNRGTSKHIFDNVKRIR